MQARLNLHEIKVKEKHKIHKVKFIMPALCRIKKGKKIIEWKDSYEWIDSTKIIIIPAGYELQIENIPENGEYLAEIIHIPSSVINLYQKYESSQLQKELQTFSIQIVPELDYLWEQLRIILKKEYSVRLTEHILLGILLQLDELISIKTFILPTLNTVSLQCQNLIARAPANKWTASIMASQLHMSISTFHRRLAEEEQSFQQILDDVRLGNALSAIQMTNKSVGDIARDNGYMCTSNFTLRFKKRYQITPLALRKTMSLSKI